MFQLWITGSAECRVQSRVQCRACKCADVVWMEGMRVWLAMGKGGRGGGRGFSSDSWTDVGRLGRLELGRPGSRPHAF